jgi:WD40 repeat protein
VAAAALPDGTPVIISGGMDGMGVRVWRLADGTPVGEPLTGHDFGVSAVAAGVLPDGTPVIISGGGPDGTVRVWRLADGHPVGEPLTGHDGWVAAVAAGALPDGTPVIISGGWDGTVRVWRTADGTPVGEPLHLLESVRAVAVYGNVIITAAGGAIAVHKPTLPRPIR